jgi:hypothetical protein
MYSDGFQRGKLIETSVVDENVETPVSLAGRINDALCLSGPGDIAADGDSLATGFGNGGDNGFRPCLARGVVDRIISPAVPLSLNPNPSNSTGSPRCRSSVTTMNAPSDLEERRALWTTFIARFCHRSINHRPLAWVPVPGGLVAGALQDELSVLAVLAPTSKAALAAYDQLISLPTQIPKGLRMPGER